MPLLMVRALCTDVCELFHEAWGTVQLKSDSEGNPITIYNTLRGSQSKHVTREPIKTSHASAPPTINVQYCAKVDVLCALCTDVSCFTKRGKLV